MLNLFEFFLLFLFFDSKNSASPFFLPPKKKIKNLRRRPCPGAGPDRGRGHARRPGPRGPGRGEAPGRLRDPVPDHLRGEKSFFPFLFRDVFFSDLDLARTHKKCFALPPPSLSFPYCPPPKKKIIINKTHPLSFPLRRPSQLKSGPRAPVSARRRTHPGLPLPGRPRRPPRRRDDSGKRRLAPL